MWLIKKWSNILVYFTISVDKNLEESREKPKPSPIIKENKSIKTRGEIVEKVSEIAGDDAMQLIHKEIVSKADATPEFLGKGWVSFLYRGYFLVFSFLPTL